MPINNAAFRSTAASSGRTLREFDTDADARGVVLMTVGRVVTSVSKVLVEQDTTEAIEIPIKNTIVAGFFIEISYEK
jgi:hypothetical protein|tara:strand:- start:63 stop:293 length:231 start_codon:yes stop_codon:yes gene_type:complete